MWEYIISVKKREAFLKLYGIEGDWVNFFNKAEGYLGTDLHQDIDNKERFISVDFWKSKEARDNYCKEFASDFDALDRAGELVTDKEKSLGEFDVYRNTY